MRPGRPLRSVGNEDSATMAPAAGVARPPSCSGSGKGKPVAASPCKPACVEGRAGTLSAATGAA